MTTFARRKLQHALVAILSTLVLLLFAWTYLNHLAPVAWLQEEMISGPELRDILETADRYHHDILSAPFKHKFWDVGQRTKQLGRWLALIDTIPEHASPRKDILDATELLAQDLFPFLKKLPSNPKTTRPLSHLRSSYEKGSRGIVIPVGGSSSSIRFAGHLIVTLRDVLNCELPLEIVHAGDDDLSRWSRSFLGGLDRTNTTEFLDISTVFDDTTVRLNDGGWAIKPFAVLASRFENVILMDADAVFLQDPEVLFNSTAYREKGAVLYHDRLLWQHAFQERHEWWKDQIKEPSAEMLQSLVWTEDYAEECDSGVVVLNKARVDTLMGLLHVAWQNTVEVREEVTYKLTHGDKESWWLGLELAGASYEFEKHYGSMLGWLKKTDDGTISHVCSFTIAHVDERDELIWYNGGLLKNKMVQPHTYEIPEYWMMDGVWEKGGAKTDMSCMKETEARALNDDTKQLLSDSIDLAQMVDKLMSYYSIS